MAESRVAGLLHQLVRSHLEDCSDARGVQRATEDAMRFDGELNTNFMAVKHLQHLLMFKVRMQLEPRCRFAQRVLSSRQAAFGSVDALTLVQQLQRRLVKGGKRQQALRFGFTEYK